MMNSNQMMELHDEVEKIIKAMDLCGYGAVCCAASKALELEFIPLKRNSPIEYIVISLTVDDKNKNRK